MRTRRSSNSQVAEVARRRLDLLSAELAAIRPASDVPPTSGDDGGSGEPPLAGVTAEPTAGPRLAGAPGRHALRAGGWIGDRLPAPWQGRVRLGAAQLSVVAVLVALGCGLLAWWSVRAADPGDLVATRAERLTSPPLTPGTTGAVELSSPGTSGAPSAAAASAAEGAELVVDVAGKVRRPGIARLPPGARVVDALEAAGGARRGVDLGSLNLARLLVDGEQVLVGMPAVSGVAPPAAGDPVATPTLPLVNLNTATSVELETLPGVGPVTAAAILQWRSDHGAFSAVDELIEVSGIGEATLAEIAPFVTL